MSSQPMQIVSTDIDTTKFTYDALVQMREKFPEENDETLARFLIARNGDVVKASALFECHLQWRLENYPVLKSSCINEIAKGKVYLRGTDREGHPLLVWRVRFNFPKERDLEEMARMVYWWFYVALSALPADKSKITLLMDRTGYTSENSDIEFLKYLSGNLQNCFPERLHRCVCYPSGLVFYGLWNIVKWFLDPVTQQKVQPMLAYSGVTQYVDPKFIPVSMGGEDDYEFNHEDYQDPYPSEIMESLEPAIPDEVKERLSTHSVEELQALAAKSDPQEGELKPAGDA